MGKYQIGTRRRWADGTDYYQLMDVLGGAAYEKFAQSFPGRGHSVDGIYYIYYDLYAAPATDSDTLKWSLCTADAYGSPGAILASNPTALIGTEDAFCFRSFPETYLDPNSQYFITVEQIGDWDSKFNNGWIKFTGQTPAEGVFHYSSAGRGYATVDALYQGFWRGNQTVKWWSTAGRDWPFLLRRAGGVTDGHMGLGYPDEGLILDLPRFNPVFKSLQNYTLTGVNFGLVGLGAPTDPLYVEFFDGRDSTAAASSMGSFFLAGDFQGIGNIEDGWLSTTIAASGVNFIEDNWYTVKFYSDDVTHYGVRIGSGPHIAHGQLSTVLTYDSGFAYVWDNDTPVRKPEADFSYYLDCNDYIAAIAATRNIIFEIQDIKSATRTVTFLNKDTKTNINNLIFSCYNINTISGHVYDYRDDVNFPFYNSFVDFYRYGSLYKTTTVDGSGDYTATASAAATVTIKPRKYDWDFVPQYIQDDLNGNVTANFYASSESKWWHYDNATGKGNLFAFRQLITFPTPHPILTDEYTAKMPFQTGYMERIATAGYFNDSIQHSMGQGIVYVDGKTHIVHLSTASNVRGATKDHVTGNWTKYWIAPKISGVAHDTHYYPNLIADNNKYIYFIQGSHGVHSLRLYKSTNPNDMSVFDAYETIPDTVNTYPRVRFTDDLIYIVYRGDTGGTATLNYVIRDNNGNYYGPYVIAYYENADGGINNKSIYICGFQADKDGTLHVAYNYFDAYGSSNRGRAVGYAYSPKDIRGIATAGMYWFNGAGHTCGVCTGYGYKNVDNCIRWMDDGFTQSTMGQTETRFNSFIMYSWDSTEAYTDAPHYYHGNTEAMFMHPTETITNDVHTIRRAHFTYHAFPNKTGYINNETQGFLSFYDSGDGAAFGSGVMKGWVTHTITATVNNIRGNGQLAWKGRNWGGIAIDNTPAIHVYGFIKPSLSTVWYGSELTEWVSNDRGVTWDTKYWTSKSSFGISAPSVKADFSNNSIEMVYGRGYDVMYFSQPFYGAAKAYDRLRLDGEDIRIVYSSASSNAVEVPRIANFFNYDDTKLYFRLQHTLPSAEIYDSAYGNYYIYHGRNETADPTSMF